MEIYVNQDLILVIKRSRSRPAFRMIEELSDFLRYIDNKHLNFKQLELNARLSIGVTVGDQQQFIATFDFPNYLLELVSKLGLHLSISAYPTTDE